MNIRRKHVMLTIAVMLLTSVTAIANTKVKETDPKAKEMFSKVYNMTFGPQGSELSYKVNIIGLYKSEGKIAYKGKKQTFEDGKAISWQDGVNAYIVNKKNREVNIYSCDDERRDKYMSKFKFDANKFNYIYETKGDFHFITAKVRDASMFGIRYIMLKVRKVNMVPVSITIKMAFMKTTVQIANFKSGNIDDSRFVFPYERYKSYKFVDHRKK